jgi:hypothetical protein
MAIFSRLLPERVYKTSSKSGLICIKQLASPLAALRPLNRITVAGHRELVG